jgi:hypothetical protein
MGKAWIEDSKRPSGVGRAERERVFWERVASGRPTLGRPPPRRKAAATRPEGLKASERGGNRGEDHAKDRREHCGENRESRWESLQLAAVTMLTVIAFGLGWVTLELERASGPKRYAGPYAGPSPAAVSSRIALGSAATTRLGPDLGGSFAMSDGPARNATRSE